MTAMFSILTHAIKFDCLFFKVFIYLLVLFLTISPPPPPIEYLCFKKCVKSLFGPLQCIKQSQKCKKRSGFFILHFGRHANGNGL